MIAFDSCMRVQREGARGDECMRRERKGWATGWGDIGINCGKISLPFREERKSTK